MTAKYIIEKTSFPLDGKYNYNVQKWLSLDGVNFYYCGLGKFCKTRKEAKDYIKADKERNNRQ